MKLLFCDQYDIEDLCDKNGKHTVIMSDNRKEMDH